MLQPIKKRQLQNEIYSFINNINISRNVNLDSREISSICWSAYNYKERGDYKDNSSYEDRNINEYINNLQTIKTI